MLVIDQLGTDLFERYEDLYTGGLRRLLDEGHSFENAAHDHANTFTAPGHVSLSTGVHPIRHGIVGNEWSVQDGDAWRSVYALEQLESPVLGLPDLPGRGPANIVREGLPDWIATRDADSRVVSVSAKDRAAIGLAARASGHVYWLERYSGRFVTSRHYRSELPDWVADFNRRQLPDLYADTLWTSEVPEAAETRSRPDSSLYEVDREHTAFPHALSELADPSDPRSVNDWRYTYTPFTDRAVTALAIRAIRDEELGQRGHLDYLGVALSAVDLVGHRFGPGSREQLDNMLRLDRDLERLFAALDEHVGRGRWVLAMSSDHGVLEIPEELREAGADASRLRRSDRDDLLAALEGARFAGDGSQEAAKAAVLQLPFVAAAYTFDEIERGEPVDSFAVLYRNSHSSTRIVHLEGRAGIHVRVQPNVLRWGAGVTTHGSPYDYDRQVPLVFLGAGVRPGRSSERTATVDAAPTLARLAGVPAPDDLDGRVLESALAR
jgi:predicted AlkP superfamily pyrophosphatase or phosphodiesterase